jgi:sensor c-di-GMP phosphodiesterase-like protein
MNEPVVIDSESSMYSLDEISTALNNEEFFLEYLPTMSLPDNRCVGAETLIRWCKGNQVIYPMEFIPIVEQTPLSGPMTYWVMDTMAKELRSWLLQQDAVCISINVPPEVFGRGGISYVAKASHLADVADKLMLEVTERGLLDSLGAAGVNVAAKTGLRIALDDIGTNDASLLVLSRIPADIVKLDKAFTDEMLQPDWSNERMAGISALISTGDLRVIAEGVETAAQLEILTNAGIQMAQGWYFSRPLRAPDFIAYFARHQ